MTIINNHETQETFRDLLIGDVYIDPEDHDVCIKINCCPSDDNAFSLTLSTSFMQRLDDVVEKVEATLTLS